MPITAVKADDQVELVPRDRRDHVPGWPAVEVAAHEQPGMISFHGARA
jgi:hypothetical protein